MPKTPSAAPVAAPIPATKKRVNITIQGLLHADSVAKAKSHDLQGGFSELVTRLLCQFHQGSGRDILKMPRIYRRKPAKKPAPAPIAA